MSVRQTLLLPTVWTEKQIQDDAKISRSGFISRREAEFVGPAAPYTVEFGKAQAASKHVISLLPKILSRPVDKKMLAGLVRAKKKGYFTALRYLSGPPISEDDLETLMDATINGDSVSKNQAIADSYSAMIEKTLDQNRFPWIKSGASPTSAQMEAAVLSTTVIIASQRTQTGRRSDERKQLEGTVEATLVAIGFSKIPSPGTGIQSMSDCPGGGKFMDHCTIGEHNADFVIGLFDGRVLAIECKASNSTINSRKRLNKETERDGEHWVRMFGKQVVPSAVLRGVFDPDLVSHAQGAGLSIFWEHRIGDLTTFIRGTGQGR